MRFLRLHYLYVLEVLFILWGTLKDIRFMGGLSIYIPFTSSTLMVSVGVPISLYISIFIHTEHFPFLGSCNCG